MKHMRWMLPGLALAALLGNGCIITSTQVFAHFSLSNPFYIHTPPTHDVQVEHVDLNTISAYKDNKDKLKGLSDIAILGDFKNVGTGPAGALQVWITPGTTNLATYAAVTGGATLLWSGSIAAAPSTRHVDWAASNAMFFGPGKTMLINQILNGGVFTLYAVAAGNAGQVIQVDKGEVVLVISAGL